MAVGMVRKKYFRGILKAKVKAKECREKSRLAGQNGRRIGFR